MHHFHFALSLWEFIWYCDMLEAKEKGSCHAILTRDFIPWALKSGHEFKWVLTHEWCHFRQSLLSIKCLYLFSWKVSVGLLISWGCCKYWPRKPLILCLAKLDTHIWVEKSNKNLNKSWCYLLCNESLAFYMSTYQHLWYLKKFLMTKNTRFRV